VHLLLAFIRYRVFKLKKIKYKKGQLNTKRVQITFKNAFPALKKKQTSLHYKDRLFNIVNAPQATRKSMGAEDMWIVHPFEISSDHIIKTLRCCFPLQHLQQPGYTNTRSVT
jgi:hypothetical protein